MVKTIENIFKPCLICVALLVPCIVLIGFLDLGFYPILFTIPILVLSTSFLITFTKKRKVVLVQNPASKELQPEDEDEDEVEEKVIQSVVMEAFSDSPGENDELNWMMISGNEEQNPEISDDSDSEDEEDGLIEIAIPSSNDSIEDGKENSILWPDSIFKHQEVVEVLAEMNEVNEEENLIEIDLSMGSIKCPRFQIEA